MIKMNNIIVKRCDLEDIDTLQEFSRQTFFETYKELCSPNDINLYSNYAFNLNNLENELTNPDSTFFFLYEDVFILPLVCYVFWSFTIIFCMFTPTFRLGSFFKLSCLYFCNSQ